MPYHEYVPLCLWSMLESVCGQLILVFLDKNIVRNTGLLKQPVATRSWSINEDETWEGFLCCAQLPAADTGLVPQQDCSSSKQASLSNGSLLMPAGSLEGENPSIMDCAGNELHPPPPQSSHPVLCSVCLRVSQLETSGTEKRHPNTGAGQRWVLSKAQMKF